MINQIDLIEWIRNRIWTTLTRTAQERVYLREHRERQFGWEWVERQCSGVEFVAVELVEFRGSFTGRVLETGWRENKLDTGEDRWARGRERARRLEHITRVSLRLPSKAKSQKLREARLNQSAWRGVWTRTAELNQPTRVQKELERVSLFSIKSRRLKTL